MKQKTLLDKCFRDEDNRVVLVQQPNVLILVWIISTLLEKIASGNLEKLCSLVSFGALFAWAWLEIFQGVNYFRRALGILILVLTLYSRL
jgi:hypothetical protein